MTAPLTTTGISTRQYIKVLRAVLLTHHCVESCDSRKEFYGGAFVILKLNLSKPSSVGFLAVFSISILVEKKMVMEVFDRSHAECKKKGVNDYKIQCTLFINEIDRGLKI